MTLVRNNLSTIEIKKYTGEAEYIHNRITISTGTLDLVNYYCPSDKNLVLDTIQVPDSAFLIAGDFNSQSQSWGYDRLDRRGEEIEAWQDENHLLLVNDPSDQHTFYSRAWHTTTTPDIALCTEGLHRRLGRRVESQLGGSDHRPILLTLVESLPEDSPNKPRWNYKKANWGLFSIRTNELTQNITVQGQNVNNVVKEFNESILKAAKEAIPRGVRKNYTPYWTPELQKTHDDLIKAREEAEAHPGIDNNNKLQRCKAVYLKTKLECIRKSWRDKTQKLNMEKDTTKLWRLVKGLNDEGNRNAKITLEIDGEMQMNKRAANTFAKAYAKESNTTVPRERQKEVRQEEKEGRNHKNIHEAMKKDITKEELKTAISRLKKKKSPGPDGITNEMLQHLGNTALQKMLDIFNLSWRNGQVPQCWREATMIPIIKPGKNKTQPSSYRPISLTSCVCKTMERVIAYRMQWYLEAQNIIVPEQAGFRQFRSTEDQTTYLSQVIEDSFQAQKVVLATFIDLQKAFDKVWKEGLLIKLLRSNIRGNMYQWTKSYLHNRRARVLVDGYIGKKVLLRQGVPQGGVLSPLLFILYINDLLKEMPKGINAALYADDLVLWCSEEFTTTATYRMQSALDKLTTWTNNWCVTINKEKSSATLFTLSQAEPKNLTLDKSPLKYEVQQTYLGITFDKRLTWKQQIQNGETKARKKLNIMRKLAGTKWGANGKTLRQVYLGTVRPHLEYGSSAWMTAAQSHKYNLEKVQNQALRIITGAMRSTPIVKMEQTTSIAPMKRRWECKALIQYTKARAMEEHLMHARTYGTNTSRLKRSSFLKESRGIQRSLQECLPAVVDTLDPTPEAPSWEKKTTNMEINTSIPFFTSKEDHNDLSKKALTMSMLEERYPREAWIRIYTDGSATDAVRRGGAGVYIQFPNGRRQAEAIPTGQHCTNYKAEAEALVHAANIIRDVTDPQSQLVFLTDAMSVLQAVTADKLPRLREAMEGIPCLRIKLQWVPSHCGVLGNEQADRMAKLGAQKEQPDNSVSFQEMKALIKTMFRAPQTTDSYHELPRREQVIIFRLRTQHTRLRLHMHRCFRLVPSPKCQCGEADQTVEHVLQHCETHAALRQETWPTPLTLQEKLHGPREELSRTAQFITQTGLQV